MKKLNKKHILPLAVMSLASLLVEANAALPGPYFGGQIGAGSLNQNSARLDDVGLAGRAFGGWSFTENLGLEAGYTKFKTMTQSTWQFIFPMPTTKTKLKAGAFDFVGKATLPLHYGLSVYGKLGVAYLYESLKVSSSRFNMSRHDHRYYPTFGLGVGYEITKKVIADVSWNRIQQVGSSHANNSLSSTDFVGVGLSYNFG